MYWSDICRTLNAYFFGINYVYLLFIFLLKITSSNIFCEKFEILKNIFIVYDNIIYIYIYIYIYNYLNGI